MNTKIFLAVAGIIIVVGIAGYVAWWKFGQGLGATKSPLAPAGDLTAGASSEPEIAIATVSWKDPAGFSFDYNKEFTVDPHKEDTVNYANLEMRQADKKGVIRIIVNDLNYKDLEDWLAKDESVKGGKALDTKVGDIPAKKIALTDPQEALVTAFTDKDNVLYLIRMTPDADKAFWQKNYDKILSTFAFIPYEGENVSSDRLQAPVDTSGDSSDANTINEGEEVVQ